MKIGRAVGRLVPQRISGNSGLPSKRKSKRDEKERKGKEGIRCINMGRGRSRK